MLRICKRLVQSCSNASNFHSITSNLVRMLRICIRMVGIPLEWFEFAFHCFESLLNVSNLHLETLPNASNLHSIASNLVRMVRICIRMVRISFEWFEFAFDCFKSSSNGSNLHLNG